MSLESQQMAGMAKIGKRLSQQMSRSCKMSSQQMSGLQMLNWHMSGQRLNFPAFELFDETFSKFIFSWKSRLKTWRVSPLRIKKFQSVILFKKFSLRKKRNDFGWIYNSSAGCGNILTLENFSLWYEYDEYYIFRHLSRYTVVSTLSCWPPSIH